MGAGIEPPRRVFSHGWWTVEGEKMSKSLGNFIDIRPLVDEFGLDQIRYFLLREVPFGNDGDFSRRSLITRVNADLANGLGNLAQRTLSFINRNAGGVIPPLGAAQPRDEALAAEAAALPGRMRAAMERLAFHEALEEAWRLIRAADAYIDAEAPWALRKTDPARMLTVLHTLCVALRALGVTLQPFMPRSMARLLDYLALGEDRSLAALAAPLPEGVALPAPAGLFPRVTGTA
jgi:methionyl-tRNA synthetase